MYIYTVTHCTSRIQRTLNGLRVAQTNPIFFFVHDIYIYIIYTYIMTRPERILIQFSLHICDGLAQLYIKKNILNESAFKIFKQNMLVINFCKHYNTQYTFEQSYSLNYIKICTKIKYTFIHSSIYLRIIVQRLVFILMSLFLFLRKSNFF